MNNKKLLIIFAVLVVAVVATRLFKSRGQDRSFREELVAVDTARVSTITLRPRSTPGSAIVFTREGHNWSVDNGALKATADKQAINIMLRTLNDLNTDQVAARSKDRWEEFSVSDSASTFVRVEEGNEVTAEVHIGRFSVQQNIQDARSYIRLAESDDVYMVPGLLSLSFDRGFNSWRNRRVVALDPEDVTRVVFSYPADSGFALSMPDSTWRLDGEPADSAGVVQFLGRLRNLINQDFVDDGRTVTAPTYVVSVEGPDMSTVKLQAEPTFAADGYLIVSSENPEATWKSDAEGLFDAIFKPRSHFEK